MATVVRFPDEKRAQSPAVVQPAPAVVIILPAVPVVRVHGDGLGREAAKEQAR